MKIIFMLIFVAVVALLGKQILENRLKEHAIVLKKVLPMSVSYEKMSARNQLNHIRTSLHMNTLLKNDYLAKGAQAHADYIVANDESSHYEVEGHTLFTGIKPLDRAIYANYASRYVSENLSTASYSAKQSIDGLFSAIYHRFGFLSPSIDQVGVGVTQKVDNSEKTAFVYLMGNSDIERLCKDKSFSRSGKYYYKICKDSNHRISEKSFLKAQNYNKRNNPKMILYPYDTQSEVPPVFYDESPDPLPNHEVSGFPISIEFNDYFFKEVKVHSFKLYDSTDTEVQDILLMHKGNDPHQRFTDKQFALFPLNRLAYNTQYKVEVNYAVENKMHTINWSFTTQKPTEELHTIESKNTTIHLTKGKSHILYLVPQNTHDLLRNIQFPVDVDITFIDHNTLKLTVMDESLDDFEIKSRDRVIHVIMD